MALNNNQEHIDKLIHLYFKQNSILYDHLFSSYNQFIEENIKYCLKQDNNNFYENIDNNIINVHGFKCDNIRIKPSTYDNENEIKFPNESRKNHLNYFGSVIVDVKQVVETTNILTGEKNTKSVYEENDISIGNIPIMVKSKYCSTHIKKDIHGECKYDPGGYFIVNGQEKVIMSIEKMVDNKILVFTKKDSTFENGMIYTAQINSRKNDWSDNLQIITIRNRKDGVISLNTSQVLDVPIFIIMRALGLESDKDIISNITYDLEDTEMLNLLRPSINYCEDENGNPIKTKEEAINYLITKVIKHRRISQTNEEIAKKQKIMALEKMLRQDFLHHLGEDIPKKRCFLGLMINKLLQTMLNRCEPDDRDALHNKRIETPGILLGQLFKQYWKKMLSEIGKLFRKKNTNDLNPINVIVQIKPTTIEQGIKTALATGVWGMMRTKNGVAQPLQRLSWIQSTSYLRRVLSPSTDTNANVISIRHINNNQYQMLCPVETPEGAKIGIVKSLSMMSTITTQNNSQEKIITTLLDLNDNIKHPADINPLTMNNYIKIFMNGNWVSVIKIKYSNTLYHMLKEKRQTNIIDKFVSIYFDRKKKEIKIYFDSGRLIRPLLIVKNNKLNLSLSIIEDINIEMKNKNIKKSWNKIITKYSDLIEYEDIESCNFLMIAVNAAKLDDMNIKKNNKIEYTESTKINRYGDYTYINYTHSDFHGWVMLGSTAANVPFVHHDYSTRNIVFFSQAKQSIGIYLTSYKDIMDISQILYHPQIPLVTTKAMEYNNILDLPFGENAIVAIMSYTGYNQEDSLVVSQAAVDRGIFRADSLKKYHSEIQKNPSTSQDDIFAKPDPNKVTGIKQGNYNKLNEKGFIPEETEINSNDIIIGKISPIQPTGDNNKVYKDSSESFKSNVTGVIDRVHTGIYNADGYEMYNVRIRMERVPIIGDKFCQKGTTQVLTDKGWISLQNINILDHKVATFDSNNNLIYINPSEKYEYDYDGDMYYYKNKHVYIDCTPNHKLYVKSIHLNNYELIEASKVYGNVYKMKNNINNAKPDIEFITINNIQYKMNEVLKLIGLYIVTGKIVNNKIYLSYTTSNIKYCVNFLNKLGIEYKYLNFQKLCINNNDFVDFLNKEIKNKSLPYFIWNLSKYQSRILLKSINQKKYTSINLVNSISRLAVHCGWSAQIKIINNVNYKVIINKHINEPIINIKLNEEKYYKYTGKVYCIEVPESHVYYMREDLLSPPILIGNSNRHGQKGTVGIVLPQKDMPFTEDGIIPDIIMNPHSIPSRMTVGQLVECMASKEAALTGRFVDGTPFNDYDVRELPKILKKLGYSPYGTEKMYCGMTGELIDAEIFIGPTYQIRLKHLVQDKVHGRARGPRQALTRQPLEGRSRDGGLKIGEMEKDAMVAHGMSQFLKERMMECSDITKVYVCDICGLFAAKVIDKDYYICKACQNTTRISAVVIPNAAKLLFQELMAVNVLPRIRTEKNIFADDV